MYIYPPKPDEIFHFGTKEHSGRYPWGSGGRPRQRLEKKLKKGFDRHNSIEKEVLRKLGKSSKDEISKTSGPIKKNDELYYMSEQYKNNAKIAKLFNEWLRVSKVQNLEIDKNDDIYKLGLEYYSEFVESEHTFNTIRNF